MPAGSEFVAHPRPRADGSYDIHTVAEHAYGVAALAAEFAAPFGSTEWARLAGLWHDLGKYHPEFQAYIRRASGYETEAHLETAPARADRNRPRMEALLGQPIATDIVTPKFTPTLTRSL